MTLSEFDGIVRTALRSLPEPFRTILQKERVAVISRRRVPPVARTKSRGDYLFGMFFGTPFTERSVSDIPQEPTRIELYKESFEKAFGDRKEIERQITITVIHEVGHYFGFEEADLEKYLPE